MLLNVFIWRAENPSGADNVLSKINMDDEIGPSTVTPFTSFRASVWMTHIVAPGGSAHRSPPRAVFRPLVAAPRSDAWLRCTGPDQVTMWVIHTQALSAAKGLSQCASRCFAEFTLSVANVLSMTGFPVRMASSGLTTVVNSTPLTRSNRAANRYALCNPWMASFTAP